MPPNSLADISAFQRAQYAFAAHIRDPGRNPAPDDVEDRRMGIYRELFYNNVEGFLSNAFPVLRKITDDDAWHQLARDFFARHRCHSPLFLEIPKEFLKYLQETRGAHAQDPMFLSELAHYEWVELALSVAEGDVDIPGVDVTGDVQTQIPVLSPLAWPLAYRFPVHRISPDFMPRQPGEESTHLVVFRDRKDAVGFVELNPVSARLMGLLHENPEKTGETLLLEIASELNHPQPETVLQGGLDILRQWQQLAILAGTRDPRGSYRLDLSPG